MTDNWIRSALEKKGLKKIYRSSNGTKKPLRPPQRLSKRRSTKSRGRG